MKYDSVQIFCPYHCGSHFLTNVIKAGYKTKILLDGSTFFHKHKIDNNNEINNFIKNNKNILFITIIKDFHFWFFSLKKESYLIKFEEEKNKLLSKISLKYPNSNEEFIFKNIYSLYLEYKMFYKNISHHKNVITLNHNDLIFKKNFILDILDNNLIKNSIFESEDYDGLLSVPQKNHGNPNYGNKLFEFYSKDISEIMSIEEIKIINKLIYNGTAT